MTAKRASSASTKKSDVRMPSPVIPPPSEPSKAEVRLREIFAEIKFFHSLCEEAISNAKQNIPPGEWHVDAEPESVRLDRGDFFQRMTADQAYAIGTHLILAAVLLDKRTKPPRPPRLSPFWLLEKLEGLMRDWPREIR